jgi:single-stranded DNA-specific DHH superfamily exonuclease
MGLERLIKDGWLDKKKQINLPLEPDHIKKIKNGEQVTIEKDNKSYVVYIRQDADMDNLTNSDLVIREIPPQATKSVVFIK